MKQLLLVLILCGGVLNGNCQKNEKRHHVNLELVGGYHLLTKNILFYPQDSKIPTKDIAPAPPEHTIWLFNMAGANYRNTSGFGIGVLDNIYLGSKNKHQIHIGFSAYNRKEKAIRTKEKINNLYASYLDDTTLYKRIYNYVKLDIGVNYGFVLKKMDFLFWPQVKFGYLLW